MDMSLNKKILEAASFLIETLGAKHTEITVSKETFELIKRETELLRRFDNNSSPLYEIYDRIEYCTLYHKKDYNGKSIPNFIIHKGE